jgi:hypothetical protein
VRPYSNLEATKEAPMMSIQLSHCYGSINSRTLHIHQSVLKTIRRRVLYRVAKRSKALSIKDITLSTMFSLCAFYADGFERDRKGFGWQQMPKSGGEEFGSWNYVLEDNHQPLCSPLFLSPPSISSPEQQ